MILSDSQMRTLMLAMAVGKVVKLVKQTGTFHANLVLPPPVFSESPLPPSIPCVREQISRCKIGPRSILQACNCKWRACMRLILHIFLLSKSHYLDYPCTCMMENTGFLRAEENKTPFTTER